MNKVQTRLSSAIHDLWHWDLLQDYSGLAESQRGSDGDHADVEADV